MIDHGRTCLSVFLIVCTAVAGAAQRSVPSPFTPETKRSIDRGIGYLLQAQNRDGSWGDEIGYAGDVSETTIAIIALMNAGNTLRRGEHHPRVRRGVDWILKKLRGGGVNFGDAAWQPHHTLCQRKLGPNIDLYHAALLLAMVLPLELEKFEAKFARLKLAELAEAIAGFQQSSGAFETSYEPMLTTVTAWLTLRSAHAAGITVHGASVDKVLQYLERDCLEERTGVLREKKWNNQMRFVTQAGGLRVFYGMGKEQQPSIRKATKIVMDMRFDQDVGGRAGGEEFLAALYAVQALHIGEKRDFRAFYPKICNALRKCQNRDGSWTGHHCITAKVYCTACAVIAMMTPNKLLPMAER